MPTGRGIDIARVAGIRIHADWGLVLVVSLLTFGLAEGFLPSWHPDWSPVLRWGVAAAAALAFFVSILLHELSHAAVARLSGIAVPRITLFMFGGLAHLESEPRTWRAELVMALAGPAASLLIGLGCLAAVAGLGTPIPESGAGALRAVSELPPLPTVLLWLGPVNVMLGLFNLIPGFPLDGGRVLRALLWGATGSVRGATRVASTAGQILAWLLVGLGVAVALGLPVPYLAGGVLNGLWLVLIGWFLNNAALTSYRQVVVRKALEDVPVERIMRTQLLRVPPSLPVSRLVNEHLLASGQSSFPVEVNGRFVGLVCLRDLYRQARAGWDDLTVGEVMVPAASLATVRPSDAASQALQSLDQRDVSQLPVTEGGRLAGLVRREDLLHWLRLQAAMAAPEKGAA
jgi:Zn-dependent protease/predicted transcriptional regulator